VVVLRAPSEPLYVSRNHLEGSLLDVPLDRVLAACHRHLVTGVVRVHVAGHDGVIELRAGAVDQAHLGDATGDRALDAMRSARDGWYEIAQRLPDFTGELAAASKVEGDVHGVPLIALMRHCEDNALTCMVTVVSGFDRACIEYRAGDIARVELNGFFDDDALPQVLRWPDARFRVAAPPLDLDVEGWPVLRRAATAPAFFTVPTPTAPARRAATVPPLPARAERYRTGDTEQRLRAVIADTGSEVPWILVCAALALAAAVLGVLLMR
jgi:hypothetical protein